MNIYIIIVVVNVSMSGSKLPNLFFNLHTGLKRVSGNEYSLSLHPPNTKRVFGIVFL